MSTPVINPPEAMEQTIRVQEKSSPSFFAKLGLTGKALAWANWISVALLIYLLITAVSVIGDGFKMATGDQAEQLFAFANNPIVALMIGVVATALIQSSSTVTSIVVGLVAGGLPLVTAIPMLMGANIGTTLTSTLVSLGMVSDRKSFYRAYSAASIHDMFNLLAVAILLPLELLFRPLERVSGWLTNIMAGSDGGVITRIFGVLGDAVTGVTGPLANVITSTVGPLPAVWGGIILIVVAIALILLSVTAVGKLLKGLMVGRASEIMNNSVGRGPISGMTAGMVLTILFQSSSTTTSLMVPLAGAGTFSLKQVYPYTLGANVGTTMTAIMAAFAFTGLEGQLALQAALIHLLFNVFGILAIYVVPVLRPLPITLATWLANLAMRNKAYIAAWVLGVFLVLPGILIFLSATLF